MIALCRPHHDAANKGVYSRDELKRLKQSMSHSQATRANVPWSKAELLVRLGGCYAGEMRVLVALAGRPTIWLRRSEEGMLLLSFELRALNGTLITVMNDNMFEADPQRLHDLRANTSGTELRFWLSQRNLGLHLAFSRLTMEELSTLLETDRRRAERHHRSLTEVRRLPEEMRETHSSGDHTGTFVKEWAGSRLDDEQRMSLLDFRHLTLQSGARRIVIDNGVSADGFAIGYSALFANAGGAFNL